jgi:tripartite-type tricarboxylate transporter receptor subunit TctC
MAAVLRNWFMESIDRTNGVAAPAGTPDAIVTGLNKAISEALAKADVQRKFQALSLEVGGGTPADASALLTAEILKWKQVIDSAKISAI